MKPHYLLANFSTEGNAQYGLVCLDPDTCAAVTSIRQASMDLETKHGGVISIRHHGTADITFLSYIPDGVHDDFHPDIAMDGPHFLSDYDHFDPQVFLKAAEEQNMIVRSECTGLMIYTDRLHIIGYEKHDDEYLVSDSLHLEDSSDRFPPLPASHAPTGESVTPPTHRFPIGTRYIPRSGQTRSIHTVTDHLTTRNHAGEIVSLRYVATHEFLGQTIIQRDVVDTTIARGTLVPAGQTA